MFGRRLSCPHFKKAGYVTTGRIIHKKDGNKENVMDMIQYLTDKKGKRTGVIIPIELWKVLKKDLKEESAEILSDPELIKVIRESEADIKAGRTTSLDILQKELGL
jgi:PHD/YefM family antitoxin component YafN of YafNO toxin-antitoxin module